MQDFVSAVIEWGSHPFPSRTRKLSLRSPMVPGPRARESRSPLDSRGPLPKWPGASSFLRGPFRLRLHSRHHGMSVHAAWGSQPPWARRSRGPFFFCTPRESHAGSLSAGADGAAKDSVHCFLHCHPGGCSTTDRAHAIPASPYIDIAPSRIIPCGVIYETWLFWVLVELVSRSRIQWWCQLYCLVGPRLGITLHSTPLHCRPAPVVFEYLVL